MGNNVIVQLKNINKLFGTNKVIDNVNLSIEKGTFVTFLGPSGCGKTTLLRMIAGFYEADSGEILISGKRVDKLPPYKRDTPMVFQEYALFPHMTVYENISYGLKIQKKNKKEIRDRVNDVLKLMQLEGLEKRYPAEMSGGQQQRVAIARALVMNPKVLLLDEPLSNLDAKLRESVRVEIRLLQKKLGLNMIYVTHDQQEALSMSDMIVIINKGVIHQFGTPREIYFKPKTKFVADFIGTTNFIEGKINKISGEVADVDYNGKTISVITDETINVNDNVVISIRPESIIISSKVEEQFSFNLKGKIKHSMFLGEKVRYLVIDEFNKEWLVDSFDSGRDILADEIVLNFDIEKIHIIYEKE
ncbi:MAG: spermidine/putrescine ABC transporter ATP-binding subunit [Clostridium sp.]|jgi:spermidine/putrescine ABC transporter ATP-binding subunit